MTRPRLWFASALAFTALFLALPELDLWAARAFHHPDAGFAARAYPLLEWLHDQLDVVIVSVLLGLVLAIALATWAPGGAGWRRHRRGWAYLVLVLLLGPGLVVNVVFKDQWGRARPAQIVEFGGSKSFTPAWVVSGQCHHNCSFVCGDASVGFSLLALAFLLRNRRWLLLGLVAGGALGLMRMAQGGHFLSDVVFSFYAVLAVAWLLHRRMFPQQPASPALSPAR